MKTFVSPDKLKRFFTKINGIFATKKEIEPLATKKELTTAENSSVSYVNRLRRNTSYKKGDVTYSSNLPSWAYLECVTAGTTGATEPDFSDVGGGK